MPDSKGDETLERPVWRHELTKGGLTPEPLSSDAGDLRLSWVALQIVHTVFRASEQREYQSLIRGLRDFEGLLLARPHLQWYYEECMQAEHVDGGMLAANSAANDTWETDQIAAVQAQLMEDVYHTLQLQRYANAPDNRGWMNLLRRWGRSPTFNRRFDALQMTFSREFVEFYALYLRYYPLTIDLSPVPHPWDPEEQRVDPRDRESTLPGVFLDSGLREARSLRRGTRVGQRLTPQPGVGGHGVADPKGGNQGYEQAPPLR